MLGYKQVKQSGFTIVELIVVIILLGILAATALPRFMDVDDEAHAAAVKGVYGGLQTGVSLFHAQWVAEGQDSANTVISEFGNLRVNADGFPYGTVDNSAGTSTVTNAVDCAAIFGGVLQAGGPSVGTATNAADVVGKTFDYTSIVVNTHDCAFYYTAQGNALGDTIPVLTYDSENGQITQSTATL